MDMRNSQDYTHIEKKIKHHQFSRTHISDKHINSLKQRMGWRGVGTSEDPIIIDNLNALKPNIWIHNNSNHLIIRNVIIYKLTCQNTQNITIESCKINQLEIEGCYNFQVKNCEMDGLKTQFSKNCLFENNKISNLALNRLNNNYFDRIMPSIINVLEILMLTFISLASTLISLQMPFYYVSSPLVFLLSFLLGVLIYRFLRQKKRTKGMPENILSNNQVLIDPTALYHEILENYRYLPNRWLAYNLPVFIGIIGGTLIALLILYFLGIIPF